MIWAQISGGHKLHLALEPGEEDVTGDVVRKGFISAPLCRTPRFDGHYRMTCNMSLAEGCKNCIRLAKRRGWW